MPGGPRVEPGGRWVAGYNPSIPGIYDLGEKVEGMDLGQLSALNIMEFKGE